MLIKRFYEQCEYVTESMGIMSSQPIIEPMEVEMQAEGEVRYYVLVYVCNFVQCVMYEILVQCQYYILVYIVVIQGEVFQDNDVFRNVVISNVCVWMLVGYLQHCVGENFS